jgi:hypothetical protein
VLETLYFGCEVDGRGKERPEPKAVSGNVRKGGFRLRHSLDLKWITKPKTVQREFRFLAKIKFLTLQLFETDIMPTIYIKPPFLGSTRP